MSTAIAPQFTKQQHRPRPESAMCTCGKLREECVRLMVREIWRAYWPRAA